MNTFSQRAMALAGLFLLAGQAHGQAIFVIDDFNTDTLYTCTDATSSDGPVSCGTTIDFGNVVWEFADGIGQPGDGLTINPVGPGPVNSDRYLFAELIGGDQVTAEICESCKVAHHVSGSGGSNGDTVFDWHGPTVDVSDARAVKFTYAADQAGASVLFTFGRIGFPVLEVTAILESTGTATIWEGAEVSLDLPGSEVFSDLLFVNMAVLGVPDLDLSIDNVRLILNQPPVAICSDATVEADANCQADASVDNGSFDPDGDPITLSQSPPGPYPQGETQVTLTVTDDFGSSDSCDATVTVIDVTPAEIECNAPPTIIPPDAPISFTATATDNCDVAEVLITEYDCFFVNPAGKRIDKKNSCIVGLSGDTLTIYDSGGVGSNIEWSVTATDSSGNTNTRLCTLEVVNPGGQVP